MYQYLLPLPLLATMAVSHAVQPAAFANNTNAAAVSPEQPYRTVEPPNPLTLQAALDIALRANAGLSAAQNEVHAVEAAITQAGVRPNPALGFEVEDTRSQTRETTVLYSQPIELGNKRAARVQAAERAKDAAVAELNAKRSEVRANVTAAFFDVIAAQERLRLANEATELAQRATNATSKRVAAGKASPVEETKARVAESDVRLELVQAKSQLQSARRNLSSTWGNLQPRFRHAQGQLDLLPPQPEPADLAARLRNAPALVQARSELDRRLALSQIERSRRAPDITLSLGVKRSEELGRNQAVIGVSVPLPLFDTNRGNVTESLRRIDRARDEVALAEIRLQNELAQATENLSALRQEALSLQTEVLPGAQSAYEAASKGFEYGKFGFLDVLDAQRTLLQAKSQYLRVLSDAHRAAADVDRLLGISVPDMK
jgi:cobalt-zinc-cadmium efflux system outer membrane protein